jgi:hypothetical protein
VRLGLSPSTLEARFKKLKIRKNHFKLPWRGAKRIHHIRDFPSIPRTSHGSAVFHPHSFQLLHDGLALAFPKSATTGAVLVREAEADGMQG